MKNNLKVASFGEARGVGYPSGEHNLKNRNYFSSKFYFFLIRNIYLFVYMLAIDGQTAGSSGLKFVEGTHGCPGSDMIKKNLTFFFQTSNFFFKYFKKNIHGHLSQYLIILE